MHFFARGYTRAEPSFPRGSSEAGRILERLQRQSAIIALDSRSFRFRGQRRVSITLTRPKSATAFGLDTRWTPASIIF